MEVPGLKDTGVPEHENPIHTARHGMFWIVAPVVLFLVIILFNVIIMMLGIHSPILNVLLILAGLVVLVLMVAGPIVGMMMLNKHKR